MKDQKPDFVTGHSLGGFYAEIASATFGLPGASFNTPGPRAVLPGNSFLPPNPKLNVGFSVHNTLGDPLGSIGSLAGADFSHVSKPVWYTTYVKNPLSRHAMAKMLDRFVPGK